MNFYFIRKNEKIQATIRNLKRLGEHNFKASFSIFNSKTNDVFIRSVGGCWFFSFDQCTWKKCYKDGSPLSFYAGPELISWHTGFLPSHIGESSSGQLKADMPGKVVRILVKSGDAVKAGDPLMILEAMKMENEIKASVDGLIKTISVQTGEVVEANTGLVEIVPENNKNDCKSRS